MNLNPSSIIIFSEVSNIENIFLWLEENLFGYIKTKDKIPTLSLVINEAIINAIVHGNKEDKSKKVTLSFFLKDLNLHIKVKDEGNGIPLENSLKEKVSNDDLLKDSGRGIILMKHFCKDIIFDKNSVELIMEL